MATFDRNIDVKQENEDTWYISGMCLVSQEEKNFLVVSDSNNNKLKLIDLENDKIAHTVTFENTPRSVAALSNDYIAVTINNQKPVSIQFYRLKDSELKSQLIPILDKEGREIDTLENCHGLDFVDNHMIVTISPPTKDENGEPEREVEQMVSVYTAAMVFKYEGDDKLTLFHTSSREKMANSSYGRPIYVKGVSLPNGKRGFITSDVIDRQVSMYQYTEDENVEEHTILLWKQRDEFLNLTEPRCMVLLDKDAILVIGKQSGNVAVLKICNGYFKFERNVIENIIYPCSSCYLPERNYLFIGCSNIDRNAIEKWESNQRLIQVWIIHDDK